MKLLNGFLLGTLLILSSCAGTRVVEEKVKTEIKNEPAVKRQEVAATAREYIEKSASLSTDQKVSLIALQEKTLDKTKNINEEINKTKMVLIKTLMMPKISEKEVSILKKNLRKLSKKQIETSLTAFEDARKIIAPISDLQDREYLFNTFMMRQNNSY